MAAEDMKFESDGAASSRDKTLRQSQFAAGSRSVEIGGQQWVREIFRKRKNTLTPFSRIKRNNRSDVIQNRCIL